MYTTRLRVAHPGIIVILVMSHWNPTIKTKWYRGILGNAFREYQFAQRRKVLGRLIKEIPFWLKKIGIVTIRLKVSWGHYEYTDLTPPQVYIVKATIGLILL